MDADLFYKTVTEELLPDIREKMIDFILFYVQMDGACPHVRRWDDLQEAGAERRHAARKFLFNIEFQRSLFQPNNAQGTDP